MSEKKIYLVKSRSSFYMEYLISADNAPTEAQCENILNSGEMWDDINQNFLGEEVESVEEYNEPLNEYQKVHVKILSNEIVTEEKDINIISSDE